jgi:hypothetical protein
MAAPTGADGWERGVGEFLVPSAGVLMAVILTKEFVGPVVAGLVYLFLTVVVLLGIYTAARYWNVRYMAGFVVAGLILLWLAPSVVSELVHPIFGVLGTLLVVVFLLGMVLLFLEKVGLGDAIDEL